VPDGARQLRTAIADADALLIATPEYNGFPTPLVINAIRRKHLNGFTRLRRVLRAINTRHRAGENPWVTALERFLAARLQYQALQSELLLLPLSELLDELDESELLLQSLLEPRSPPDDSLLEDQLPESESLDPP
jgi:hypothetical protein